MTTPDDGLFLLEALVDKIVFLDKPHLLDDAFKTCVTIKCPAMASLEICDDDASTNEDRNPSVKYFNSGKSFLFSLKEEEINQSIKSFQVQLIVSKTMQCGCLPTKVPIGTATIDMTKEFVQARNNHLQDPGNTSYQALKDSFKLFDSNGMESGHIVIFLRISFFGKLIVTSFQGTASPTKNIKSGVSLSVNQSSTSRNVYPKKPNTQVCMVAQNVDQKNTNGGGAQPCTTGNDKEKGSSCPPAKDPYNSKPCEDPDDPCYCSGPKQKPAQNMACRNADQYCLHVPKGGLLSLPCYQDPNEDQLLSIKAYYKELQLRYITENIKHDYSDTDLKDLLFSTQEKCSLPYTDSHYNKQKYSRRNVSFTNTLGPYARKETEVYMTLYKDDCRHRYSSGTQATALLNKCFQVNLHNLNLSCDSSRFHIAHRSNPNDSLHTQLFGSVDNNRFFGVMRKSTVYIAEHKKGMGKYHSTHTDEKSQQTGLMGKNAETDSQHFTTQNAQVSQTYEQPRNKKTVSIIKDNKRDKKVVQQYNAVVKDKHHTKNDNVQDKKAEDKGNMKATVSHIKIGPKGPCPVCTGVACCKNPCDGKSIDVSNGQEQAAVKVSSMSNPRKGVFELVIRKLTGAPLAKNELMLEWTLPPTAPCCGYPCFPSKCKMIACKASTPKCCKKLCTKPCGSLPCWPLPCKSPCRPAPCTVMPCKVLPCRRPCSSKPCRPSPCKPYPCRPPLCRPPSCRPFRPCKTSPCRSPPCLLPCELSPCGIPCGPLPCASPCSPPSCRVPCRPVPCRLPCRPAPCRLPCRPNPCRMPCGPAPCRRPCRPCRLPCKPPPCGIPCGPPFCRRPCRPSPCVLKCRMPCFKSCGRCPPRSPSPCSQTCCRSSSPRCCIPRPRSPCCKPRCASPPCCSSPCSPSPCPSPPPCISPCSSPCKSSPCLRPCPVGRGRPRRCRSQPKIRPYRKKISPCQNRSQRCPVARRRSLCARCCNLSCCLPCPPSKCAPVCCKSASCVTPC